MRILALAALFVSLPSIHAQKKAAARAIPVVRTWEDLAKQEPIELDKGVKIWLGIEAERVPRWSGAVLYCLTEGYSPPGGFRGQPLGPVQVSYVLSGAAERESEGRGGREKTKEIPAKLLFTLPLPVDRVGTFVVRIRDEQKRLVASCNLEGTKEAFHPWTPWFYLREQKDNHKDVPIKGIAFPAWDGVMPSHVPPPKEEWKATPLPTFLPSNPTPDFTIALQGDELTVRSKVRFTSSGLYGRCLVRWWVNDKPFVPEPLEPEGELFARERIMEDTEIAVPLHFQPKLLGAMEGDRIGLQLLYSQSGWTWSRLRGGSDRHLVLLSNRIDFKAGP
jgi:hypothetical protein